MTYWLQTGCWIALGVIIGAALCAWADTRRTP